MSALWYLLKYHGTRLEADLQRFYQVDLADYYRGLIGARKLAVLAVHLPPESAVMRAEGGDGSLTITEHALRAIGHRLELQLYQNGGGKGKKPAPPSTPETFQERRRKQERAAKKLERSRRGLSAASKFALSAQNNHKDGSPT